MAERGGWVVNLTDMELGFGKRRMGKSVFVIVERGDSDWDWD